MDKEVVRLAEIVRATGDLQASIQLLNILRNLNISFKALYLEYGIPKHLLWDSFKNTPTGSTYDSIVDIIKMLDERLPGFQWVVVKESLIVGADDSGAVKDSHYMATISEITGTHTFYYIDDPLRKVEKVYEKDPKIGEDSLVAYTISRKLGADDA